MRGRLRLGFWIEAALAALSSLLLAITLIVPEWIEFLFEINPDSRSGALEWGIVIVLLGMSLTFSALARAEWKTHAATMS